MFRIHVVNYSTNIAFQSAETGQLTYSPNEKLTNNHWYYRADVFSIDEQFHKPDRWIVRLLVAKSTEKKTICKANF